MKKPILTKEIALKMAEGQMKAFKELWPQQKWYNGKKRRAKIHLQAAIKFSKIAETLDN